MEHTREIGTPRRITSSGITVITSGNASLLGIAVPTVLTGQIVQLWSGSTSSVTATPIIGTATMATNTFTRLPAMCNGGITICVTNEDVDLTIFWNPEARGS